MHGVNQVLGVNQGYGGNQVYSVKARGMVQVYSVSQVLGH